LDATYNLSYNYATKQWTGKSFRGKYFIVPYKTQQTITVCGLPENYSATIDGEMITVTPEAVQPESLSPICVVYLSNIVEADEVEYTLQIKDSRDSVIEKSVVFVKVFGGLKIDISTGVVLHSLANESYHLNESAVDEFTLTKDNKKGNLFPISPVVLTHFHARPKGFATLGTTVGLGINDEGKVGYYLGGALLIGDRQRAIISTGIALRPVEVLKGKYQNGEVFDDNSKPEIDDLTESIFKTGFFFSFSYNLSSKVERKK
jgi:hypothetical protein